MHRGVTGDTEEEDTGKVETDAAAAAAAAAAAVAADSETTDANGVVGGGVAKGDAREHTPSGARVGSRSGDVDGWQPILPPITPEVCSVRPVTRSADTLTILRLLQEDSVDEDIPATNRSGNSGSLRGVGEAAAATPGSVSVRVPALNMQALRRSPSLTPSPGRISPRSGHGRANSMSSLNEIAKEHAQENAKGVAGEGGRQLLHDMLLATKSGADTEAEAERLWRPEWNSPPGTEEAGVAKREGMHSPFGLSELDQAKVEDNLPPELTSRPPVLAAAAAAAKGGEAVATAAGQCQDDCHPRDLCDFCRLARKMAGAAANGGARAKSAVSSIAANRTDRAPSGTIAWPHRGTSTCWLLWLRLVAMVAAVIVVYSIGLWLLGYGTALFGSPRGAESGIGGEL